MTMSFYIDLLDEIKKEREQKRKIRTFRLNRKIEMLKKENKVKELTNLLINLKFGKKINDFTIRSEQTNIDYVFNYKTKRYEKQFKNNVWFLDDYLM